MKVRLLVLSSLLATSVIAQQPQQPTQRKSEEQQRREEQQRQQQQQQSKQQQQQQQQRSAEASQQDLKVTEQEARKEVTDANKASSIIGMQVVNRQNEDLGKIKDIVVDLESGKVAYVVLSSGGFFGTGGRLVAVPVDALTLRDGQEGFVIDADKSRLEQAQGFSEQDWPAIDAASNSTVGLQPSAERQDRYRAEDDEDARRRQMQDPNRSQNR